MLLRVAMTLLAATLLPAPRALAQSGPRAADVDAGSVTRLARALRSMPLPTDGTRTDSLMAEPGTASLKSPLLAGGLSAILPGTGQIYAKAPLWRTLLYGAVEAAGWTLFAVFTAKGDRETDAFQRFADDNWDVTRYVEWISGNYQRWADDEVDKAAASEALATIYRSRDPNLSPWERIDFQQLNRLERAVHKSFSHTLPAHGQQQYYEEIGKYTQYRAGWSDHDFLGDTLVYDNSKVTARNLRYTADRARANSYYDYATAAVGTLLLNHVASMMDAFFQARGYNASVRARLRGALTPTESPYPELTLSVGF